MRTCTSLSPFKAHNSPIKAFLVAMFKFLGEKCPLVMIDLDLENLLSLTTQVRLAKVIRNSRGICKVQYDGNTIQQRTSFEGGETKFFLFLYVDTELVFTTSRNDYIKFFPINFLAE